MTIYSLNSYFTSRSTLISRTKVASFICQTLAFGSEAIIWCEFIDVAANRRTNAYYKRAYSLGACNRELMSERMIYSVFIISSCFATLKYLKVYKVLHNSSYTTIDRCWVTNIDRYKTIFILLEANSIQILMSKFAVTSA